MTATGTTNGIGKANRAARTGRRITAGIAIAT